MLREVQRETSQLQREAKRKKQAVLNEDRSPNPVEYVEGDVRKHVPGAFGLRLVGRPLEGRAKSSSGLLEGLPEELHDELETRNVHRVELLQR